MRGISSAKLAFGIVITDYEAKEALEKLNVEPGESEFCEQLANRLNLTCTIMGGCYSDTYCVIGPKLSYKFEFEAGASAMVQANPDGCKGLKVLIKLIDKDLDENKPEWYLDTLW